MTCFNCEKRRAIWSAVLGVALLAACDTGNGFTCPP